MVEFTIGYSPNAEEICGKEIVKGADAVQAIEEKLAREQSELIVVMLNPIMDYRMGKWFVEYKGRELEMITHPSHQYPLQWSLDGGETWLPFWHAIERAFTH